jgi:hypothetical protein
VRHYLQNNQRKSAGSVAYIKEHLPNRCKALSSNPSTTHTQTHTHTHTQSSGVPEFNSRHKTNKLDKHRKSKFVFLTQKLA